MYIFFNYQNILVNDIKCIVDQVFISVLINVFRIVMEICIVKEIQCIYSVYMGFGILGVQIKK